MNLSVDKMTIQHKNAPFCQELCQNNKQKTESQFTPSVEVMELLLAHGAPVNVQDYGVKTPLEVASERGFEDAVNLLRRYDTVP